MIEYRRGFFKREDGIPPPLTARQSLMYETQTGQKVPVAPVY
jgi:hypothetical protein